MAKKHSWYFPPRNGGIDFVQDPSSAHFSDSPIPKLVRELIQNSLDARQSGRDRDPIIVTFTDTEVPKEIINAHQLSSHVAACRHRAKEQHHADVAQIYETALQTLRNVSIRCLRVTDASTTGLSESKWDALVLQEGAVQKPSHIGSPGGSYGIGKKRRLQRLGHSNRLLLDQVHRRTETRPSRETTRQGYPDVASEP